VSHETPPAAGASFKARSPAQDRDSLAADHDAIGFDSDADVLRFERGLPPDRLRRAGACHNAPDDGRGRLTSHRPPKRKATLTEGTRRYNRQTPQQGAPLRSPSFGAVQCLELLRGKQALWRARPPILRTQSRSKPGKRQTCASQVSHSSAQPQYAVPI